MDKYLDFFPKGLLGVLLVAFVSFGYGMENNLGEIQDDFAGGSVSGNIDLNGNLLFDSTQAVVIGTAATPGHSFGTGDTTIGGDFEVDGISHFDGQVNFNSASTTIFSSPILVVDDTNLVIGTGSDTLIQYDTNQSADALLLGLSTDSNSLIVSELNDTGTNWGHAQQTNPTIFVHSADATDAADWISFTHDQTNGVITVGSGAIKMASSTQFWGSALVLDDLRLEFGGSADVGLMWSTAQTDGAGTGAHAALLFTAVGSANQSGNIIITNTANKAKDHDHAFVSNPALIVHSATDPDSANDEWISITHDVTNGVIDVGSGVVSFLDDVSLPVGKKLIFDSANEGDDYIYSSSNDSFRFYAGNTFIMQFTATLVTNEVNLNNKGLIYDSANALKLGTDGTPDRISDATGETFIGGALEIDGISHFDGQVLFYSVVDTIDNTRIRFGSTNTDSGIFWGTYDDNSGLTIYSEVGSSDQSGNIKITAQGNRAKNHHLANTSELQFYIFDANTDPDSDATQYLSLHHDGSNGVIDVGSGRVQSTATFEVNELYTTRHQIDDQFFWSAGVLGSVWDLTNVTGAGTNTIGCAGEGACNILTTGAAGAADYESTWSNNASLSRAIQPDFEVHATLGTDLVGKEVRIGFCDTVGDGTGCTDYVYFLFDYSNDNVNWFHSSGDAGDASLAVGPTADTEQDLRIELDSSGNAKFYIDDSLITTVNGAVGADTNLYFFYAIETEAAQAEALEIEHLHVSFD